MSLRSPTLALGLSAFLFAVLGAGAFADTEEQLEAGCPVRFVEIPESIESPELPHGLLLAEGVSRVQVVSPSSEGLFVMRADETGTAKYGRVRRFEKVSTRLLDLQDVPSGLYWMTATSSGDESSAEVSPGSYRIYLEYLSPNSPSAANGQVICIAMSKSFHVSKAFYVHRFS